MYFWVQFRVDQLIFRILFESCAFCMFPDLFYLFIYIYYLFKAFVLLSESD